MSVEIALAIAIILQAASGMMRSKRITDLEHRVRDLEQYRDACMDSKPRSLYE